MWDIIDGMPQKVLTSFVMSIIHKQPEINDDSLFAFDKKEKA